MHAKRLFKFARAYYRGKNVLTLSGIALIALGLFHIPVWYVDGSDWDGSVSWRKPILFGISTGLTLWSLGWLVDHLTKNKVDIFLSWLTSQSLVAEVMLIAMQQWRGVASHFNQETSFDSQIDIAMYVLICIAFAGIVYLTVRSFSPMRIDANYQLAIRSGMLFLVISCLIGFAISSYGYTQVESDLSPEIYGQRGITKFPHGVAIHALQLLPAIVWLTKAAGLSAAQITTTLWLAIASLTFQLLFACHQTWFGLARFELSGLGSWALFTLAAAFAVVAMIKACSSLAAASTRQ